MVMCKLGNLLISCPIGQLSSVPLETEGGVGRVPIADPEIESSAPVSAAAHLVCDIWQVLQALKVSYLCL